jgi:hypothetical protein
MSTNAASAKPNWSRRWSIVARRPSVRIVEEGSAALDDGILTVDLTTRTDLTNPRSLHSLGLDFGQSGSLTHFRTYSNGAYFSVEVDGRLAHGDAWSLASLLSDADTELAAQEVLYVGEAFGKDGSTNVWRRVRAHEKLQQIYEDHADIDCDIFVVPLSLERRAWVSDDHIDDDDPGPSMEQYYRHFATEQGGVRKASVDLIEHSLISYFTPHYNELLIEWRQETPTKSIRLMRDAGFRLIQVHLSGWWGLARFYSAAVPSRFRSHLISHDLPPAPRRPLFHGIAAERLSDWRHSAMMVQEGQELLEEAAERTGTGLFVPAIADVAAKGELRALFKADNENKFFVEGADQSVELLEALCRAELPQAVTRGAGHPARGGRRRCPAPRRTGRVLDRADPDRRRSGGGRCGAGPGRHHCVRGQPGVDAESRGRRLQVGVRRAWPPLSASVSEREVWAGAFEDVG